MAVRKRSWDDILAGEGIDVKGLGLTLERVYISKATNSAIVRLNSDSLIDEPSVQKIESCLRRELGGGTPLRAEVAYPALADDFMADPEKYKEMLCAAIGTSVPLSAKWLLKAKWQPQGNAVRISTDSVFSAEILNGANVAELLQRAVKHSFGTDIGVMINGSGDADAEIKKLSADIESFKSEMETVASAEKPKAQPPKNILIKGRKIEKEPMPMRDIDGDSPSITVEGEIISCEKKEAKDGALTIYSLIISDKTNSINAKLFLQPKEAQLFDANVKDRWLLGRGEFRYDTYDRGHVFFPRDIMLAAHAARKDNAPVKRVELHMHTKYSDFDGMAHIKDIVGRAAAFGHDAVAVTDHGVVQAFPEGYEAANSAGLKLLLGVEGYLESESSDIVKNAGDRPISAPTVVFDLETTGLDAGTCKITEIGAVKISGGIITDRFSTFVNPETPIPAEVVELTGITDAMVAGAPTQSEAIASFAKFSEGCALAAHNAAFDISFLRIGGRADGHKFAQPVIDTLAMAQRIYPGLTSYKLGRLASHAGIRMERAHRAVDDAAATASLLLKMLSEPAAAGLTLLSELNTSIKTGRGASYHIVIFATNQKGLYNLYKLISLSHTEYFYRNPRIPRAVLQENREGLLLGSACEAGELIQAILNGESDEKLLEIASFYDYLEIQPDGNNAFLIRSGRLHDTEALHDMNRKIIELGEKLGKPVAATGDVHFLNPEDAIFREIIMRAKGFDDAGQQAPLYYRTTEEMLEEFSYLGEEKAYEVVVENTRRIADMINPPPPFPEGLHAPDIPGAADEIRSLAEATTKDYYGENPPEFIQKRLKKELDAIIGNNYSVLYLIAHKLVKNSNDNGYFVGSRGSVGSSFVATMTGITEVNPLPPHYLCRNCHYGDFDVDGTKYFTGADLPDKVCPICGKKMRKEGFNIPFESFMGFKGNKVPDIDLNFSGDYQPKAHKFIEEMFGADYVFRAGTTGTVAENTAYGYVKKYEEDTGRTLTAAEEERLKQGCMGVKTTTGQHPGGLVVLPKDNDILNFSPIQYPANKKESGVITTHFEFSKLHDCLVKLDILGHDDPTMIRALEDFTGTDMKEIPLNDPDTLALFRSPAPLGLTEEQTGCATGTMGVPEFGTAITINMLKEVQPTTVEELVRLSGLSHGEGIWQGNARDLLADGTAASLFECICTREDIMNYLEPKIGSVDAFDTMESVRKGRGIVLKRKDGPVDMEPVMRNAGVPQWCIESLKKIKYMFPRAHAAAYVTMGIRIAWYKLHEPLAYYAAYFSIRAKEFDCATMLKGQDTVRAAIKRIKSIPGKPPAKEARLLTVLELTYEMYLRGIRFLPIDLYESDATMFRIVDGALLPPFNVLAGVGDSAAQAIVDAREGGPFLSVEDLVGRSHISSAVIEALRVFGVLDSLSTNNQVSLFE